MRCPVCTVDLETGPSCRRCRADLSLLFQLEEERAHLAAAARRALMEGQGAQAVALANAMAELRAGEDSRRLRALGLLLQRAFAEAYMAYHATEWNDALPFETGPQRAGSVSDRSSCG